ncbi:MAG: hypothetical protein HYR88_13990 [Verrucomicrobia bacterium]|nr:hypothetical protein [Verrucomicrobiota bacterium]MBI3871397.1 hypothetical protein [Verrucomicrobiota bacterium]
MPSRSSRREGSHRFLITSSGAAATRWLGGSLNRHPDICCSCGPGALEVSLDYDRTITSTDLDAIADFHSEHLVRGGSQPLAVDALFDALERSRDAAAYGNIHAETVATFANNILRYPPQRPITVVNLIRHPIPRTESKAAILRGDSKASRKMSDLVNLQFEDRLVRHAPLAVAIADQVGDFRETSEQRHFVNAVFDTIEGLLEFETPGVSNTIRHYPIESLKSDPGAFRAFVAHITAGRVGTSDDFLAWVFSPENLNAGRTRKDALGQRPPLEPHEQWQSWEEWQRRVFQVALESTRLRGHYEERGYDFSCLGALPAPRFPGFGRRILPAAASTSRPLTSSPALFNQMP